MTQQEIATLKQDIVFHCILRGFPLTMHTTWGLFSPKNIDEGTTLLLEKIELSDDATVLDLGCGYGPIGLTMARLAPRGKIHMVDTNVVAISYARKNTKINNIPHCSIYLSNGFQYVGDTQFDAIVSNLPAKIGKELFWILLSDAKKHLKHGGKLYIVTITGLREFIKRNMTEQFGNYEKIGQNKTYTAAVAVRK